MSRGTQERQGKRGTREGRRGTREAGGSVRIAGRVLAASCVVALGLAAAAPAYAKLFDYTASLELGIGSITPFTIEANGQIDVSPDGSFTFPAGILTTTRTLVPPQTTSEAIASVEFQMTNGEGTFGGPATPGGTMSLNGQAVLHLQPFLGFPALSLGISPLGVGGTATVTGSNGSTSLTATLTGAPWQTGVFQQTGFSSSGTFSQRTNTGADLRTSGGEGMVTLVVPAYITTRREGVFSDISPITGVLSITFTPEPAPLLAHGAMLVVVGILYQRRVRRRRAEAGSA